VPAILPLFDINPDQRIQTLLHYTTFTKVASTYIVYQDPTMASFFRKMDTQRLHNSEMKELVRVLRSDSHSTLEYAEDSCAKATGAAIKKLPRRLRTSPFASCKALCCAHKGLDAHLIDHVWSWIKFELEVSIGRFLYPVIMSDLLDERDKLRARQLEPVIRMFRPEYTLARSSPPGIKPIDVGDKWAFQKNGCPACMLARLGSDENVLFALFAGMYGHHRSRNGGRKGVDKIKSKRLRFVRYWMRTYPDGKQKTADAYDLGVELKELRREAKASLRQSGQPVRYTRDSLDQQPTTARHCLDNESTVDIDLSNSYNPKDWFKDNSDDHKLGLATSLNPPPPTLINLYTDKPLPATPHTSIYIRPPTPDSPHTLSSPSLISAPLHPSQCTSQSRHDSLLDPFNPSPTIPSSPSRLTIATSIASFNNTSAAHRRTPLYDPFETPEERLEKYRKLLNQTPVQDMAKDDVGAGVVGDQGEFLPKPSRGSICSAFGELGFEEADESSSFDPVLDGIDEDEDIGDEDDDIENEDDDFDEGFYEGIVDTYKD
jgi:hypothetical protein